MLAATHTVVAGTIGSYIENPLLAFLAGVIIHFLLDATPHYDTTDEGKYTQRQYALVIIDFIFGILLIALFIKPHISLGSPFLWGAIGGNLPDAFDCIPFWQNWFRSTSFGKQVHYFHDKIHNRSLENHPILGLLIQYVIIVGFIWINSLK